MPSQGPQVAVEGLRDFQRMVKVVQPELRREVPLAIKIAAERTVLPVAKQLAPKETGRLAGSLRVSARVGGAAITSRLPYANVQEWGGTTGYGHSRSHPGATRVRAHHFVTDAVERRIAVLAAEVGYELDKLFRRNGWR